MTFAQQQMKDRYPSSKRQHPSAPTTQRQHERKNTRSVKPTTSTPTLLLPKKVQLLCSIASTGKKMKVVLFAQQNLLTST
jgi:hypothetical protein